MISLYETCRMSKQLVKTLSNPTLKLYFNTQSGVKIKPMGLKWSLSPTSPFLPKMYSSTHLVVDR